MPSVNLVRYGTFGGVGGVAGGPSYSMALVPGFLFLQLSQLSNASPTFRVPTVGGVAATYLGTELVLGGSGLKSRLYGFEVTTAGTVVVEGGLSDNFYTSGLLAALVTGQNSGTPYAGLVTVTNSTNSIDRVVSSAAGNLVLEMWTDFTSQSLTQGAGSTLHTGVNVGATNAFVLSEPGAASVTIGGTFPATTDGLGFALSVVSAVVAPIITGPTGGTPGTTTITIGATSDSPSDGTMRFLRRVGGSAASAATVASTGESQAATANPQSRAMTGFTASSVNNFVDMVQVGAGGNSNVLSYGPFTMAAAGTAPSISVQPASQTVTAGATAGFSVTASGSGTLTYQWRRNGTNIGGATSASYTTPATTVSGGSANNGDLYSVVVTGDTAPAATSSNATLTVNAAPGGSYSLQIGPGYRFAGVGRIVSTLGQWSAWQSGDVGSLGAPALNGSSTCDTNGIWTIAGLPNPGITRVLIKSTSGEFIGYWVRSAA